MEKIFEMMKELRPEHKVKTYYTYARMETDGSDRIVSVILPVDVYEYDDMGFEIMPVRMLAAHCPWDMEKTIVTIDTEFTHFHGNLHDIIMEDIEVHKNLCALDEGRE